MSEEREKLTTDNVVIDKAKLYLLAQKLKDVAAGLDNLSEEDKRVVIERADKKDGIALKGLYDSLNDYLGWYWTTLLYFLSMLSL